MADEILLAHLETKRSFLTVPDERVLFAKRKHWYMLFFSICKTSTLGLFLVITSFIVLSYFLPRPTLFIPIFLTILLITFALITKTVIDWYCHLYVVTTRKILEVCLSPLFSDCINDILLDQVRCTEVDVERSGFLRELLDVGNVAITFDRPTHQQEVVFADIEDSERAGIFLSDILVDQDKINREPAIWFREKQDGDGKHRFRFTEEIFPGVLGVN